MGKWRGIFFLAAFFSGVVLGSELFFQSFSLRSLRVESGDPVAELFFWKNISSSALRFWPFFFLEKDELKKKIESESPLSCSITRRGIAGAEIRIDPLQPWVTANWSGRDFFVTREGIAWESNLLLNKTIKGISPPKTPLIAFSDEFPPPSGEAPASVVSRAIFPLDVLNGWLEGLAANRWISRVERIDVSRREGQYLLKLVFDKGGANVLLWGDAPRWKELDSVLSQIMQQLHFLGDNVIIDTTYTDRIIVRSMVRGDQEGSGR